MEYYKVLIYICPKKLNKQLKAGRTALKTQSIVKTTVKNLLIAQNYSDAAKDINMISDADLHAKKILKTWNNAESYESGRDDLYYEKSIFLMRAMKSAKREKIHVVYDPNEGCLYFEFNFGQCSFHYFGDLAENVIERDHKWNGETNTGKLLREKYKEIYK